MQLEDEQGRARRAGRVAALTALACTVVLAGLVVVRARRPGAW